MAKVNLRSIWSALGVGVIACTVAVILLAGRQGKATKDFIDVDKGQNSEITISEKVASKEIRLRKPGSKITIKATFTPSNTTNQGVEWTLSDGGEDYLTIKPSGLQCQVIKEANFVDSYTLTCTSIKDPDISHSVTFTSFNYAVGINQYGSTHNTNKAMQGGEEVLIHIAFVSALADEGLDYDRPIDDDVGEQEFMFDDDFQALFDIDSINSFYHGDNGETGEDYEEYVEFKICTQDDILEVLDSITSGEITYLDNTTTIEFTPTDPEDISFNCNDEILI